MKEPLTISFRHTVTITNVSFHSNNSPPCVLNIYQTCKVVLINVTFWNNSTPMLSLTQINDIVIGGQIEFSDNIILGQELTSMNIQVGIIRNVQVMQYSTIKLHNNYLKGPLVCLHDINNLKMVESNWFFINNTSQQGGIMVIEDAFTSFINSEIKFGNNTTEGLDGWDITYITSSTMLLLQESAEAYFLQSKIIFRHNSASDSGGITLINSHLIFENSNATFEYNEGGDGGAMAFYEKSYMLVRGKSDLETINLNFYCNKAVKRGGAIFVEDLDYMNSVTHMSYIFFIRSPHEYIEMADYIYISPQINASQK